MLRVIEYCAKSLEVTQGNFLNSPPCIRRPRWHPSEYCYNIWDGKKLVSVLDGEKLMFSRFDAIPACDGRTDILRQHSTHYA